MFDPDILEQELNTSVLHYRRAQGEILFVLQEHLSPTPVAAGVEVNGSCKNDSN